jgi:hypothetical protein
LQDGIYVAVGIGDELIQLLVEEEVVVVVREPKDVTGPVLGAGKPEFAAEAPLEDGRYD